MPSSSEYQIYAHECLRWADNADNDEDRRAFLEMAKVWTQLALHGDEAEPISRRRNSIAVLAKLPELVKRPSISPEWCAVC